MPFLFCKCVMVLICGIFFLKILLISQLLYSNSWVIICFKGWACTPHDIKMTVSIALHDYLQRNQDHLRKNYSHNIDRIISRVIIMYEYRLHRQCLCLINMFTIAYIYVYSFVVCLCPVCSVFLCQFVQLCIQIFMALPPQHTDHNSKSKWKVSLRTQETYLETKSSGTCL